MIDAGTLFYVSTLSISLGLVAASKILERRYPLLERRGSERALALYVYYSVPACASVFSRCGEALILWPAFIHIGWIVLFELRREERARTFAIDPRRTCGVTALVACISSAATAHLLDCRMGELAVAAVFAIALIFVEVGAHAVERQIPRPYRERELIASVGLLALIQTCASLFLEEPWGTAFASVVALLIGMRLTISTLTRVGAETATFCETVYESGGALYGAREALNTPIDEMFLRYCDTKDPESTRIYRESVDREHGAILEGERVGSLDAARALEPLWLGFVQYRAELPGMRVFHDLEHSDTDSEEEVSE